MNCPICGEPCKDIMVDLDGTNLENRYGCVNQDCPANIDT